MFAGLKYDMYAPLNQHDWGNLTDLKFGRTYCWVVTFNDEKMITKVRAYIDTELLSKAMAQNS